MAVKVTGTHGRDYMLDKTTYHHRPVTLYSGEDISICISRLLLRRVPNNAHNVLPECLRESPRAKDSVIKAMSILDYAKGTSIISPTDRECAAYEPFRCPGGHVCISIQYLCDGAPDCPDGYDENLQLCTAAKRPPVEETASFLQSLLASHGPNYLEKLFGTKARNALKPLGGVQKVAVALSESQTIDDFGRSLNLMKSDVEHLRSVFMAVENGDIGMLKSLGIKDSELGDVKFFLEKLVNTGFLD
ncbi:IDLSRF-like peptide [Penaeus japonicus]|uniref:IDLSRF-like peptide n=1 Tax=Penaeus japonicus TaxID=27405 RepID=UPI001C715BEA|nr:IDLSRF-like peptide [Penaeus japonicus]